LAGLFIVDKNVTLNTTITVPGFFFQATLDGGDAVAKMHLGANRSRPSAIRRC